MSSAEMNGEDADFFRVLEKELHVDGIVEQAEAVDADRVRLAAEGLGRVIEGILPAGRQFAPLEYSSYARDGALAEDGHPLLLTPEDAYAVAKERPDVAALMAQTAYAATDAKQQQMEVDLINAIDDPVALQTLAERQDELDYRVDRLEFWAAVAALHPFDETTVGKYFTSVIYPVHTHMDRTLTLAAIEAERFRLMEANRKYSPGYLDAYEEAHGADFRERNWVNNRREWTEKNALTIKRYSEMLADVANGRVTVAETAFVEEIEEETVVIPEVVIAELKILQNLPGLDPVRMTANNRLKELPQDGWLIDAQIGVGTKTGKLQLHRYTKGGLRISDVSPDSGWGEARLGVRLMPDLHGTIQVVYEDATGEEADSTYEEITLVDDGKVMNNEFLPVYTTSGEMGMSVMSHDVALRTYKYPGEDQVLAAARVTDSSQEARQIAAQLGRAMGMSENTVGKLLETLETKDAFGDLKRLTPEEQGRQKRALRARTLELAGPEKEWGDDYDRLEELGY